MAKEVAENQKSESLLTPKQVAEMLQVEIQLLNHWRSVRKGPPFIKVVHQVRYRESDLEAWLKQQQVSTEAKLV